jgi:ribosomal protein S27E
MHGIYLTAILTTGIAAAIFAPLIHRLKMPARIAPGRMLFGRRRCPECGHEYDAPLIGINFGLTRYERCPHCRHWHWTKVFSHKASNG